MKKTHMLRCRSIVSLQRTVSTPPLIDFRAPRLWIFLSSLQEAFFRNLLGQDWLLIFCFSSVLEVEPQQIAAGRSPIAGAGRIPANPAAGPEVERSRQVSGSRRCNGELVGLALGRS
jgi:hypothetical protein